MARAATVLIAIVMLAALLDYLFSGRDGVVQTLLSSGAFGLDYQHQNAARIVFTILLSISISLMLMWVSLFPKTIAILMSTVALVVAIFIEPGGLLFDLVIGERGIIDFSTAPIFLFASILIVWAFFQNAAETRSDWWPVLPYRQSDNTVNWLNQGFSTAYFFVLMELKWRFSKAYDPACS